MLRDLGPDFVIEPDRFAAKLKFLMVDKESAAKRIQVTTHFLKTHGIEGTKPWEEVLE